MMFTAFNTDCDSSSRCSTASPATGDNLGYYPSPAGSYSDLGSPQSQDFTDLTSASASFVPTVTAISTSPDLQWMVQPFSSVAPSNRVHPYSSSPQPPAYPRTAMKSTAASRAHSKKGRSEQVSTEEEEKRKVRRERNKQAAAKCRNRRRELTDTLQAETDELEDEKANIQNDIANLLKEKERLEFILAAHRPICKIPSDLDVAFPATMSVSPARSCGSSTTTEVSMQTQTSPVSVASSCTTTAHQSVFTSNSIFSSAPILSTITTATAAADRSTVRLSDLDAAALEESLDLLSKVEMECARSVPEVDLSSSLFAAQDWEPLYTSTAATTATTTTIDFEPLCTPVVTCTPSCTTYTSSFAFTYPEADALFPGTCGVAHRRGSSSNEQSSDSLSSPTLLAL